MRIRTTVAVDKEKTQETARRDRRIRDTQMCGTAVCAEGADFTAW